MRGGEGDGSGDYTAAAVQAGGTANLLGKHSVAIYTVGATTFPQTASSTSIVDFLHNL